jgi:hypothetical protein
MYYGSGYIGKGDFWKFDLIFGLIYFAGLLPIVLPWLQWVGVSAKDLGALLSERWTGATESF